MRNAAEHLCTAEVRFPMCDSPAHSVCGSTGMRPTTDDAPEGLRSEVDRLRRENTKLKRKIVNLCFLTQIDVSHLTGTFEREVKWNREVDDSV